MTCREQHTRYVIEHIRGDIEPPKCLWHMSLIELRLIELPQTKLAELKPSMRTQFIIKSIKLMLILMSTSLTGTSYFADKDVRGNS